MPFGYKGDFKSQLVKNSGIFSPEDVLNLSAQGFYGGSLELIQAQTVSGVNSVNFTNIQGDKFRVMKMDINDVTPDSDSTNTYWGLRFSSDGGSSYRNTATYSYGFWYGGNTGSVGAIGYQNATELRIGTFTSDVGGYISTNSTIHIANAHDSALGTFAVFNGVSFGQTSVGYAYYGMGSSQHNESINAISLFGTDSIAFSGQVNLYGYREL